MKKLIACILCAVTVFSFVGCGEETPEISQYGVDGLNWDMSIDEVIEVLGEPLSEEDVEETGSYRLKYEDLEILGYRSDVGIYFEKYGNEVGEISIIFISVGGILNNYMESFEPVHGDIEKIFNKKYKYAGKEDSYQYWLSEDSEIALKDFGGNNMPVKLEFSPLE